ncbi:hypothetical protein MPSEU_000991100 [Mayamaea pseudoterrestris]|nr:hypothetical protein MPSEU_000991100 [Mayamaea pseudoterrestris]
MGVSSVSTLRSVVVYAPLKHVSMLRSSSRAKRCTVVSLSVRLKRTRVLSLYLLSQFYTHVDFAINMKTFFAVAFAICMPGVVVAESDFFKESLLANDNVEALEIEDTQFMVRELIGSHYSTQQYSAYSMSFGLFMSVDTGTAVRSEDKYDGSTDASTDAGEDPASSSVRTNSSDASSVGASAGVVATASLLAAAALVLVGLVAYRRHTRDLTSGTSSVGTDLLSMA